MSRGHPRPRSRRRSLSPFINFFFGAIPGIWPARTLALGAQAGTLPPIGSAPPRLCCSSPRHPAGGPGGELRIPPAQHPGPFPSPSPGCRIFPRAPPALSNVPPTLTPPSPRIPFEAAGKRHPRCGARRERGAGGGQLRTPPAQPRSQRRPRSRRARSENPAKRPTTPSSP